MGDRPIIIGVTGGSGSGKSSVSKRILEQFTEMSVLVLAQDNYYKDQSHLTFEERLKTNYDHPFAFDNDLFYEHIQAFIRGEKIEVPIYDFVNHTRSAQTREEVSRDVLILEGILIFEDKLIRDLCDIKIYVDTEDDIRLARRIKRDVIKRGRSVESVLEQYESVVKPMHHQFTEPTKRYADIIVPEGGHNHVAIDLLVTKINTIIN
ncbi:uridine kinase [Facklamia miroungae]|uniref:Uridine kinase n=1 Tax=Facklamia miroungae TaxID=120956 RepID=A0A1G7V6T2_9LACT|nr:uridine kinase [Facklamia miroungae]NKZ30259.1 uridine kinase [Facklamia miroungae]SDG55427.1 uridine kinase [Facklamia miroungae]